MSMWRGSHQHSRSFSLRARCSYKKQRGDGEHFMQGLRDARVTQLQLSHTLLVCGQDKSGAFSHHVNVVGTPAFPKPELHSQMHPPTSPSSTLSVYRQTKGFLPARDGSSAPAVMACFHPRHWQRPSDCLRLGHFCTLKSPCLTPVNLGWSTCTKLLQKRTEISVRFYSASRPTQQHVMCPRDSGTRKT